MCGRFTYRFTWTEIHDHLQAFIDVVKIADDDPVAVHPARYNIAPTQPIVAIRRTAKGNEPGLFRWGLVPVWVKDPNDFPLLINARIETAGSKPAFRGSVRHMRCIVPASGFYEWKKLPDGSKQPYYITLESGEPMLFAGLYAAWEGPEGGEIDTAAIVTQASTGELSGIHDRTPAVLRPEQLELWLDTSAGDAKGAEQALASIEPLADLRVTLVPVGKRVGSIRNDDPGLIDPVGQGEQPADKPPARPRKKAGGQGELF